MSKTLTVNQKSEFFVSIAKQGIHTYLMLGVIDNHKPITLAKIGKSNLIDQDFDISCTSQFGLFKKELVTHTDAAIVDERLNENQNVNYQAYSITYQQYLDFLHMLKMIHLDQLSHYQPRILDEEKAFAELTYPEKGVYKLRQGIQCFIPTQVISEQIQFQYQDIKSFNESLNLDKKPQEIISGAKQLSATNTCRTTARSILNYVLGYSPKVPELFLMNLDYHMKKEGDESFYVLPAPPNCFKVDTTRMQVLQELYAKLEDLPKNQPQSKLTRDKFDILKQLYRDITSSPDISFDELLCKITEHKTTHRQLLDAHRGQSIISLIAQKLGLKTSTQASYDRMVKAVMQELDKRDKEKTKLPQGLQRSDSVRPPDAEEIFKRSLQRFNRAF